MTPHRNPFATAESLRRTAAEHLAAGRRAAARRALLDAAILEPQDAAVRRDLAALTAHPVGEVPHAAGLGALIVVAVACAVLAFAALIAGLDVSAILLAVAGLLAGRLIARRLRPVA